MNDITQKDVDYFVRSLQARKNHWADCCADLILKLWEDASKLNRSASDPQNHEDAMVRIDACTREIEKICDTFGYDPAEWLVDAFWDTPITGNCEGTEKT